ncbi:histidine kinase N-terminal 7TM domain-containing protein [Flaviaesturariibacter terrae]
MPAFQPLSLLFFIPALINLGIAAYIVFFLPRSRTVDLFAVCVVALSIWQVEEGGYMYIQDAVTAYHWDKVFCFGWILLSPAGLHFACSYTRKSFVDRRFFLVLLYLPFLLLHGLYVSDHYNHLVRDKNFGWVIAPDTGFIDALLLWIMAGTMFAVSAMLLAFAYRVRHDARRRTQAVLVALGILVPTIVGFISQVLFPLVLHINELPLSPALVTLFSLFTIVALVRYRLFDISESVSLNTVLHQFQNIVLAVLPDRSVQVLNQYTSDLFGQHAAQKLMTIHCFGSAEAAEEFDEQVLRPAFDGRALRNNMVFFQAGDRAVDTLVSVEPVRYRDKVQAVLVIANDITDYLVVVEQRKRAERQLEEEQLRRHHEITEAVIAAQENERRIIGAELHDNVNQILTSAKLYVGLSASTPDDQRGQFLDRAGKIIGKAMEEVRKLSHSLIPPSLSGETLVEALRHLLENQDPSGLQIQLDVLRFEEESVPPKLKLTVYRIVQEQWSNIIKHAYAQHVTVTLKCNRKLLVLEIKDDGVGFDPAQLSRGVGLKNIETRARLHEGKVSVLSQPNKGCVLQVKFPLSIAAFAD